MKTIRNLFLGAALAIFLGGTPGWAGDLKVGDTAPDFKLEGSDGKTYQLSDFKGKQAVVVAWFPKAFTGGCTAECKSLKEHGPELRKFDVSYFTASVDALGGAKGNKAFAESLSVDYPILSDPTMETAKAYGVLGKERPVAQRWTFYIGKDGKILEIDKAVKPASHAEDMIAKFKELGIAQKK